MKYGVIGTGWIAESFIEGTRLQTGADFCAVYSRTMDKGSAFAQKNSIGKVYTDIEEFAKGDFDAVYIASPNALHYSQSRLMLENGKHVICEKPITVTPEELSELQHYAETHGLIYMEAIMYLHQPAKDKLKSVLAEIGEIHSAHFDFSQLSSKYPALKEGKKPNIFNPSLATGGFMDLGIYCIYPMVDIFGTPSEINGKSVFTSTGSDISGSIVYSYNDVLVSVTYSKVGQDYSGSQIIGDKGTITLESISKLTNIKVRMNNGTSYDVECDVPKPILMGNEGKSFEKYISGKDLKELSENNNLALKVSKVMSETRKICKINFN